MKARNVGLRPTSRDEWDICGSFETGDTFVVTVTLGQLLLIAEQSVKIIFGKFAGMRRDL
jgi:hypothetical protein